MRFLKSCGAWFLLLFSSGVQAQAAGADSVVLVDTVLSSVAADPVFHFDTIPPGNTALEARTIPDSTLQRLRREDAFWYANAVFKKKADSSRTDLTFLQRLFSQAWFRKGLWALIITSFVVVLLLFLMKSNLILFHKKPALIQLAGEGTSAETIFSMDYESAIRQAKAAGDLRRAVRLHFLQTLTLLSQKNHIQCKEGFTNSDYLAQLRQSPYYGAFKKLTRHYEYTWYGHFPVTPDAFANIEMDFSTFKNSMGS